MELEGGGGKFLWDGASTGRRRVGLSPIPSTQVSILLKSPIAMPPGQSQERSEIEWAVKTTV